MYITKVVRFTNFVTSNRLRLLSGVVIHQPYRRVSGVHRVQSKPQISFLKCIEKQKCHFHTSERRYIPPALALIIRPIIRLAALLFGRKLKKWYNKQSPEERKKIHEWFRSRKKYIFGSIGLYFLSIIIYYLTHLEYDPLSRRTHFIMLNKEQREKLGKLTFETHLEEFKSILLPKTHPTYNKLLRITARLVNANRDLPNFKDKKWTLTVVDSPSKNAYVLPGGNIFVFSGILQMTENDDQLAIVLAHEMAHAALNHHYEQVSRGIITELILAIPIALTWAIFPDLLAGFFLLIGQSIIDVFHTLPYSRALENEADNIGLKLAAKACVDVREAVVFWGTMRTLIDLKIEPNLLPSWLSTHPDHGDREKRINTLLPENLLIRDQMGCPILSNVDPRKKFYQRSLQDHELHLKQRGVIHF